MREGETERKKHDTHIKLWQAAKRNEVVQKKSWRPKERKIWLGNFTIQTTLLPFRSPVNRWFIFLVLQNRCPFSGNMCLFDREKALDLVLKWEKQVEKRLLGNASVLEDFSSLWMFSRKRFNRHPLWMVWGPVGIRGHNGTFRMPQSSILSARKGSVGESELNGGGNGAWLARQWCQRVTMETFWRKQCHSLWWVDTGWRQGAPLFWELIGQRNCSFDCEHLLHFCLR